MATPLPALPLEPVHVEDDPPPEEPQQHYRGHVGGVADVDDVVAPGQGVDRREQRVDDGFEVLGARRRETDDAHAEVRVDLARDRCVASVDGDVVAPRHQAPAELLGERLEAAVVGRHAAGAEDRDAHGAPMVPVSRPGQRRFWRPRCGATSRLRLHAAGSHTPGLAPGGLARVPVGGNVYRGLRVGVAVRLGFDLSILRHPYGGTARYAEELLLAMRGAGASGDQLVAYRGWRRFARGHRWLRFVNLAGDLTWTGLGIPGLVLRDRLTIWYSPSNIIPPLLPRPAVVTIHDVNFLLQPEAYEGGYARYAKAMVGRSARRARHVITDSEFSRQQLIRVFKSRPTESRSSTRVWTTR